MQKLLLIFFVFMLSITQSFAYSIKVYDDYGNRVGTYRKEGDKYQLYDFNDNKVENPDELIKNAPNQKILTEYSQIFYDSNMMPIGTLKSGFYGNNGRYYPRHGHFYPAGFHRNPSPYIVRPSVKLNRDNINYIDTRFARFHKL